MKSKIFSNKNIVTAFKSQSWLPLFIAVGFLFALPVAELVMLGRWEHVNYTAGQMKILYANLWRDGFVLTGTIVAMASAFVNGASSFMYLYSRRKADFYHSLPVNRKQIFLQRLFTGLVFYIIPYVIMEFLAVCIGASRGFFSLGLMGMAVKMMIFHLLEYLLIYFCTVFILSMTGNILMGILCSLGIVFYFPALSYVLGIYGDVFFKNYYYTSHGILGFLSTYFSPLCAAERFLEIYRKGEGEILLFFGIFLAAAVIGIISFLAFEKRPLEKAGNALVYSWCEPVVRFMVIIPAGLGIGLFAYMAPAGENGTVWAVAGTVFGMVMIHGILETFYHFDFRCFLHKKLQLVISIVAVAAIAFIFKKDLIGYGTYIPEYEDIECISLGLYDVNTYESIPEIFRTEGGKYEEKQDGTNRREMFTVVEKTPKMYEVLRKVSEEDTVEYSENMCYIPVRFDTGLGRKIYRQYAIDSSQCRMLMEEVCRDSDYINWKYGFLNIEEKYSGNFTLSNSLMDEQIIKKGEKEEFLENLRKDIKDANAETFTALPCALLYFDYGILPSTSHPENMVPGKASGVFYSGSVYLYPEFRRTVAFLKEKGYYLFEGIENLEYADVYYTKENKEEDTLEMITVRYEEKKQIEELEKAIIPEFLTPGWAETEDFQVEITYIEEDDTYGSYPAYGGMGHILKDKVPDFILEDSVKVQEGLLESNIPLE